MLSEALAEISQPLTLPLALPAWVWGAVLGGILGIMGCIDELRKPTENERERIRDIASRPSPDSAELLCIIERLSGEELRPRARTREPRRANR